MNQKKALVLLSRDTEEERLAIPIEALKEQGFDCEMTQLEMLSQPLPELMSAYDCLVLGNLTIGEASRFRDFQIGTPRLQLCYEALRQGKTVYAVSADFEIHESNTGLLNATEPLLSDLSKMGLKVIAKRPKTVVVIDKNLVSLSDVSQIGSGAVSLNAGAVLTFSAKQYLEEKGIVILRK